MKLTLFALFLTAFGSTLVATSDVSSTRPLSAGVGIFTAANDAFAFHVAQDLQQVDQDQVCDVPPNVDIYFDNILAQVQDFNTLFSLQGKYSFFEWPRLYTQFMDWNDDDEKFGVHGEQTTALLRRFQQLKTFWAINNDELTLKAIKMDVLKDTDKMVNMYRYLFNNDGQPISKDEARTAVKEVQAFIESDPGMSYDFTGFTFDAYSFTAKPDFVIDAYLGNVPDTIMIGDGLLDYFATMGIDAAAPVMVLAHEFGHQIQFALGLQSYFAAGTPEATRYLELMADAFAGYFLAHTRGTTFQAHRIVDVLQAATDLGDCSFRNSNHHGTSSQRRAAITFGTDLAARNKSTILSAKAVLDMFNASFDRIIAASSNGRD